MPVDPGLVVSTLSFLVSVYQAVKPHETVVVNVLQEVRGELLKQPQEDPNVYVQKQIEERLDQETAKAVNEELSLLQSFVVSAAPESFMYYELLLRVFRSARAFCDRTDIFRLRGFGEKDERFLDLRRTGIALCSAETRKNWMQWPHDGRGSSKAKTTVVRAYLSQRELIPNLRYDTPPLGEVLPIVGQADFTYETYLSMGGSLQQSAAAMFYVSKADEDHWLRYQAASGSPVIISFKALIRSQDVAEIITALRDDILEYVEDIRKDKAFSDTDLKTSSEKLIAAMDSKPAE